MGIATFFIVQYADSIRSLHWIYPVAFFILGIAHQGVRWKALFCFFRCWGCRRLPKL
ncbi:hypothetical protein [Prolixibacter bellariivorans]|uniref:hypothetical protein n=1 Tax=Prolixibacter bellariivorans TaxID=314319 RepID=UPI00131EE14E|nr:hypothetical protein [Prolixibacter bellariivorans]